MRYSIGIDAHKKTSQISVLDRDTGLFVFRKSIRSWPKRFEGELAPYLSEEILIEASTVSLWLAPFLRSLGHKVVVGDPNNPLMYASRPRHCKNDSKDADALAFALKNKHYSVVYEPNEEQRPIAELLGTRTSQIRRRTSNINRVRALYASRGVELANGDADTFWSRVKALPLGERVPAAEPLLDELAMLEDLIAASEKKVNALAANHPVARRLMTVPGVGPMVALAYYVKIGDPSRFGSARQVEAYLGLIPVIHASAKPGEGKRISKRGSSSLRGLLGNAAWSHVGSSDAKAQPLREWFLTAEQRMGSGKAITAVTRKLAGILFAMWRDGNDFELREAKATQAKPAPQTRVRARRYQLKSSRPLATGV
jgi:transposase